MPLKVKGNSLALALLTRLRRPLPASGEAEKRIGSRLRYVSDGVFTRQLF